MSSTERKQATAAITSNWWHVLDGRAIDRMARVTHAIVSRLTRGPEELQPDGDTPRAARVRARAELSQVRARPMWAPTGTTCGRARADYDREAIATGAGCSPASFLW